MFLYNLYGVSIYNIQSLVTNIINFNILSISDIYAALWPFLGIVAEVVILCLVIFIYEKKRMKAEYDESDTDQGPDQ